MTETDNILNIRTFDKTDGWLLVWLAAIFFCLYFLTATVLVRETGDGGLMYRDASVIYRDLGEGRVPGTGDTQLSKFSPGQPLLNIPTLFFHYRSLETTGTAKLFWILLISLLPIGLATLCNLMVFSSLRRLGVSRVSATAASILAGTTSMIWPYTQSLTSDLSQMTCLTVALFGIASYRSSKHWSWATLTGAMLGYAVLCKPTAVPHAILGACLILYLTVAHEKGWTLAAARRLVAFFLPALVCAVFLGWYNYIRFENPFAFGYLSHGTELNLQDNFFGFNTPILTGLYGLLLSSGKGVLWYSPTILAGILAWSWFWKKERLMAAVCASVIGVQLAIHVKWWAWSGDYAWGPRFLLPAIPFFYVSVGFYIEKWKEKWTEGMKRLDMLFTVFVFASVVLIGLWVQALGLLFHSQQYFNLMHGGNPNAPTKPYHSTYWRVRDDLTASHFVPEYSAFATYTWLLRCNLDESRLNQPPWISVNPAFIPKKDKIYRARRFNVWWLCGLQSAGKKVSPIVMIVPSVLAFLVVFIGFMIFRLVRGIKTDLDPASECDEV